MCRRCEKSLLRAKPLNGDKPEIIIVESPPPLIHIRPKEDIKCLGENIRFIRKSMGMTAVAFAAKVPTRSSYVSRIENGSMHPSIGMLEKMALALEVSVGDVLYPDTMTWILRDQFVATVARECMRKIGDRQRQIIVDGMADFWANAQRRERSRLRARPKI